MGNFVFCMLFFCVSQIFHHEHTLFLSLGRRITISQVSSSTTDSVLWESCLPHHTHPLLRRPSHLHLHLHIILNFFFPRESQSLRNWLLLLWLGRTCMSVCLSALLLPMMAGPSVFLTADHEIPEGGDPFPFSFFQLTACP